MTIPSTVSLFTIVTTFLCLWFSAKCAAKCPTSFLPSEVLPSVSYKYTEGPLAERIAQVQAEAAALVQSHPVDAYSIAAIHRNRTIFTAGASVHTPFRIGSITKIFAAMGALVLRERGLLGLDDPVTKFLPKFSIINPYDTHQPTLRELMSHTSGLPRELCPSVYKCGNLSEEDVLKTVAKMELARPPWSGPLPLYSNLGISILAHAWEKATSPRQSWSDYLKGNVFSPLGMHTTGVDFAQVQLAPGSIYEYPSNHSIGWSGPAGDMYSTASDLARFLKFMLKPKPELLSASVVREWTQTTTPIPDSSVGTMVQSFGFGMMWELFTITTSANLTTTIIGKDGGLGSYASLMAFHPGTELGVAVLVSNTKPGEEANASRPLEVAIKILGDLIPEVSSYNSKTISSLYSGVYVCDRSEPVLSQYIGVGLNKTLQVIGGSVTVTATTLPDDGLIAAVNISLLVDGNVPQPQIWPSFFSSSLLLKNGHKNVFWAYPGLDCLQIVQLSSSADVRRPNYPGSFDFFEVQFDPSHGFLRWPSLGAVCRKSN